MIGKSRHIRDVAFWPHSALTRIEVVSKYIAITLKGVTSSCAESAFRRVEQLNFTVTIIMHILV